MYIHFTKHPLCENRGHAEETHAIEDHRPAPVRPAGRGIRAAASGLPALAQEKRPVHADMHSHYGMFQPRIFGMDLAQEMRETGAMLLAWSATTTTAGSVPPAAR
jgi:hypothetical protein